MGQSWDYECAVIGGGPGGLVSSIYLRRFRRSVVLIGAGKPRAAWIPKTHNLMGFPQGISGRDLLRRLNRQANKHGVERVNGQGHVTRFQGGFRVSALGHSLKVKKVILATGIEDIQPVLPNIVALRELGLLRYCPVCDAFDYCDKSIAVLAHDDHGIAKALFLSRYTKKLSVVVPTELKLASMRIHELRTLRIKVVRGRLLAIEPSRSPQGGWIYLDHGPPLFSNAIYPMFGCRVRDEAFREMKGLKRTKAGFVITTTEQRTSIPGLFAVGDCVNLLAQLSVASGQGAVAATTLHDDLCQYC